MIPKSWRICGLDEAGRGALAGPLVAAAVTLKYPYPEWLVNSELTIKDGKLLKPQKRLAIYKWLKLHKVTVGIEYISTRSINNHGIGWANREIFRRLIRKLEADEYIIDGKLTIGKIRNKSGKIRTVVNADATIIPVILSGIIAKVERDKVMTKLHLRFPHYKWSENAGYGTKKHLHMLKQHGECIFHRRIFVITALKNFALNY